MPRYSDLLSLGWDVDYRLSYFVEDPKESRGVLGYNEALIVGSLPLQFFSQVNWKDCSLDVFIQSGIKADAISDYSQNEGYGSQEPCIFYGQEYEFEMTPWVKDENIKVNIISADFMSLWAFFEGPAFSTASSCFITSDAAYCLFPEYTYGTQKLKWAQDLESAQESLLPIFRKHVARGWCLNEQSVEQGSDINQEFEDTVKDLGGPRRIGDEKTWVVPLDCTGIPRAEMNRTVVERNTFQVQVKMTEDGSGVFVRFETLEFQCCILEHRYTFDAAPEGQDDFHEYLRYVLCRRAAVQIQKHIDEGTFTLKKVNYRQALAKMATATETKMEGKGCNERCHLLDSRSTKGGFIVPEGWEYHDNLIPEIWAEWLKAYSRDHGIITNIQEENDEDEA
ncbi:unnamed protein product [Aureobasidium mustum]|uniref:Uncharacterized protein n=1 Tax=Aureobasidium mustum TaxID=2773714 RepID=A0A9N8PP33_9PEZI|nr:unnamed protein product [Aureobasidium mustum]